MLDSSNDLFFVRDGLITPQHTGAFRATNLKRRAEANGNGVNFHVSEYVMPHQNNTHERDYIFSIGGSTWTIGCEWALSSQSQAVSGCLRAADSVKPTG